MGGARTYGGAPQKAGMQYGNSRGASKGFPHRALIVQRDRNIINADPLGAAGSLNHRPSQAETPTQLLSRHRRRSTSGTRSDGGHPSCSSRSGLSARIGTRYVKHFGVTRA